MIINYGWNLIIICGCRIFGDFTYLLKVCGWCRNRLLYCYNRWFQMNFNPKIWSNSMDWKSNSLYKFQTLLCTFSTSNHLIYILWMRWCVCFCDCLRKHQMLGDRLLFFLILSVLVIWTEVGFYSRATRCFVLQDA